MVDFYDAQIFNVALKLKAIINDNLLTFKLTKVLCNQNIMARESMDRIRFYQSHLLSLDTFFTDIVSKTCS